MHRITRLDYDRNGQRGTFEPSIPKILFPTETNGRGRKLRRVVVAP